MDQANVLRSMLKTKPGNHQNFARTSRVISITSGKGGVGKTNFAVNLAIYFSQRNKRVVILDADFGLANIEVLFGVVPRYSLADILMGNKTIEEVLTAGPNDIKFISGGSGLKELANITDKQIDYLLDNFTQLDRICDIILVDTGAGLSNTVINFIKASDETIVITTPEPPSITDAYALIKTIKENHEDMLEAMNISYRGHILDSNMYDRHRIYDVDMARLPDFKMIINRTDDDDEGIDIFKKLQTVSERFLDIRLSYLGSVGDDEQLIKAVKKQKPVMLSAPNSIFSKSIVEIGDKLLNINTKKAQNQQGIKTFIKRLINIFGD